MERDADNGSGPRTLMDILPARGESDGLPAVIAFQERTADTVSRADLAHRVDALAAALHQRGIAPGDRIVLRGAASPAWITAALAAIRLGAVVVPIDAQMADDNLAHVLRDSAPSCILTDADDRDRLCRLGIDSLADIMILEETVAKLGGEAPTDPVQAGDVGPEDDAVLFYTSGTTGAPKGVPLTHANLAFQVAIIQGTHLLNEGDRVLMALPPHHVYPFVIGILTPLAMKLPIVLPKALTGPQLVRAVGESRATALIGVPRLYRALYEGILSQTAGQGKLAAAWLHTALALALGIRKFTGRSIGRLLLYPLHRRVGANLHLMASGGSALDPELALRLEAIGWRTAVGYGLTETAPLLSLRLPGQGSLASVGKPAPGVELKLDPAVVADAARSGESDSRDSGRGEILARGPGVFRGYRHLEDATAEVLDTDGWFRTGDLGRFDDDGYLYVLGRVSTMIVTEGGENVQPEDVERLYGEALGIREMGVLERNGKLAALVVPDLKVLREQQADSVEDAVRQAINARSRTLPSYMRIADMRLTREALPRTRLGKIRRHLLAEAYDDAHGGRRRQGGAPLPVDAMSDHDRGLLDDQTARRVWEWLCDRFPDRGLSPDSSPQMDLDVDSMEWLNLTLEIRERAGIELDEAAIARVETVRDLLTEAANAASKGGRAADPVASPYEVLTVEQQRWLRPLGPGMRFLARVVFRTGAVLMRALYRIRVSGMEHVPESAACVLMPNHTSYLDPLVLGYVLGADSLSRTYWAGLTTAAFDTPAKRLGCRLGRAVPINPGYGAVSGLAFAAAVLKRDQRLVWFPEGQRSPDGSLVAFKPGLGKVLNRIPVPVVPVRIGGAHEAWPVHRRLPRPGTLTVTFGEPVSVDALMEQGQGAHPEQRIIQLLRHRLDALG